MREASCFGGLAVRLCLINRAPSTHSLSVLTATAATKRQERGWFCREKKFKNTLRCSEPGAVFQTVLLTGKVSLLKQVVFVPQDATLPLKEETKVTK